eukprot:jgi/Astpho2/2541/Aster-04254
MEARVRGFASLQTTPAMAQLSAGSPIEADSPVPSGLDFGYSRELNNLYTIRELLGTGGNAVVRKVTEKQTGTELACKSLLKELKDAKSSTVKKAQHPFALRQEVTVLKRLSGSLNVARLQGVFEDDTHVHLVMELCRGGELIHAIGARHYSERTVASYMRAVLRTLAQCHTNHVLHRDVKPGNFMLADDSERAPLKAIDFGLAVPYEPEALPRSDLGLEGTPWYMAPEVLSSEVTPASDIWSAGVMAFQLLTGRFPFDDRRNPFNPSISKIWQAILTDRLDFKRSCWAGISDEAKNFVQQLLQRGPGDRPTAREALQHPWLRGGTVEERSQGKPLSLSAVQRIQFCLAVLCDVAVTKAALPADDVAVTTCVTWQQAQLISSAAAGYKLDEKEVTQLLDSLDLAHTGLVAKSQLAASQIDWREQNHAEQWLHCVRRAFEDFDTDHDGVIALEEIIACLRSKLPPQEVAAAVEHAMQEAHKHDDSVHEGISFHGFMRMLAVTRSMDNLDQYDDKLSSSAGSYDRLRGLMEQSRHGSDQYARAAVLAA